VEREPLEGGEEITIGESSFRFFPEGSPYDLKKVPQETEDTATGLIKIKKRRTVTYLLLSGISFLLLLTYLFPPKTSSPPPRERPKESLSQNPPIETPPPPQTTLPPSPPTQEKEPPREKPPSEPRKSIPKPSPSIERSSPKDPLLPFHEFLKTGDLHSALSYLAGCTLCPNEFQETFPLVLTPPQDLPSLLKQLTLLKTTLSPFLTEEEKEMIRKRKREEGISLIKPFVEKGEFGRVKLFLETLHREGVTIPFEHPLFSPIRKKVLLLSQEGYTLLPVNPEEGKKRYRSALELLPSYDPLYKTIEGKIGEKN